MGQISDRGPSHKQLELLRQHAIHLYKSDLLRSLWTVQNDTLAEEGEKQTRRSQIQAKLKRLQPGKGNTIGAIMSRDKGLLTEPADIARELRRHWQEVFSQGDIDKVTLNNWLREELPGGGPWTNSEEDWYPSREDFHKAVKKASKSMPGPDGLQYGVWKCLGEFGANILFDVAEEMKFADLHRNCADSKETFDYRHPNAFNLGNLFFVA